MGCTPPKAGVECNFLCPKVGSLGLVEVLTLKLQSRGFEMNALNTRCAHGSNTYSLCWGQFPLVTWSVSLDLVLVCQIKNHSRRLTIVRNCNVSLKVSLAWFLNKTLQRVKTLLNLCTRFHRCIQFHIPYVWRSIVKLALAPLNRNQPTSSIYLKMQIIFCNEIWI
ncbi:hypothetical protein AVEN_66502-1 [Araneus ventricosus]|uniref:Uncharacterized protein n=1 Tax=Araneus ventricosus TaxID=182803 RepID=A0A4Y2MPI1_ARAVE|nr:hypothetical protein AVEN_117105-1 [Araneus ventricosus]GBN54536.1 hypothetical protein AVEN_66502-1 [Araneus ventricosus]